MYLSPVSYTATGGPAAAGTPRVQVPTRCRPPRPAASRHQASESLELLGAARFASCKSNHTDELGVRLNLNPYIPSTANRNKMTFASGDTIRLPNIKENCIGFIWNRREARTSVLKELNLTIIQRLCVLYATPKQQIG
jgi:hypothetical protein